VNIYIFQLNISDILSELSIIFVGLSMFRPVGPKLLLIKIFLGCRMN